MSQKTDLQAINNDLRSILDDVKSLPDKVEAPTYETCKFTSNREIYRAYYLTYAPGTGLVPVSVIVSSTVLDDVVSGSIVIIDFGSKTYASAIDLVNAERIYPVDTYVWNRYHILKVNGTSGSPSSATFIA